MPKRLSGPYVSGRLTNKQQGSAIGGATITVNKTVYTDDEMQNATTTIVTDGTGGFQFYALPGLYTFTTTAVDAAPIEPIEILGNEGLGTDRTQSGASLNLSAPAWQASTFYSAGTFVTQAGTVYSANADFTSGASFNATNWTAVGTVATNAGTIADPVRVTAVWKFGNDNTATQTVWDDTSPSGAMINWNFNKSAGEGIHLTSGPNFAGSAGSGPNILAIGNNYGGVGVFINNYLTGVGLKITNRNTITNSGAYGFLFSQNSNNSIGMYLSAETSTCQMPLQIVAAPIGTVGSGGAATNQIMTEWRRSQAATADTLLIRFLVDGALFQVPVTMTGGMLTVSGFGTQSDYFQAQSSGAYVDIYDTGGTTNTRRYRLKNSSSFFSISSRNDVGASSVDLLLLAHTSGNITTKDGASWTTGTTTGLKIGASTTNKIGFFNATPVVQQGSTPAAATDLATAITLVNDLRTKLVTYGLAA